MGLIPQPEAAGFQGLAQPVFDVLRTGRRLRHARFKQLHLVLAGALGPVHGRVGRRHQSAGIPFVVREDRNAHAHGGEHVFAFNPERGFKRAQQIPATRPGFRLVTQPGDQHNELVAADAGDGLVIAQPGAQPFGNLLQEQVANLVAPGVVDALEAVQVDEQYCHPAVVPVRILALPSQSFAEQQAVGKAGEHIVPVLVGKFARAFGNRVFERVPYGFFLRAAAAEEEARQDGGAHDAATHEPPGPPPGRQHHKREYGGGFTPGAFGIPRFHLQTVVARGQGGELQIACDRLFPLGEQRCQAVPEDQIAITPESQRGETDQQRIGGIFERHAVRRVHLVLSGQHAGEHGPRGAGLHGIHARQETGKPAAGPDPDMAIGLRGKRVQIAVVPDQAVVMIEPVPAAGGLVKYLHAQISPRPESVFRVKTEKVGDIGGVIRVGIIMRKLGLPIAESQPGDGSGQTIPDPDGPVGICRERNHGFTPQPLLPGKLPPFAA